MRQAHPGRDARGSSMVATVRDVLLIAFGRDEQNRF
jgi:hypothetical protein